MSVPTHKIGQKSLQSEPDFCNLQSGCKLNSLKTNGKARFPDCRFSDCKFTLQSGIPLLHQQVTSEIRLYCRPYTPMGYIGVVPAHAVLLLCKALLVNRPELGVEVSCE